MKRTIWPAALLFSAVLSVPVWANTLHVGEKNPERPAPSRQQLSPERQGVNVIVPGREVLRDGETVLRPLPDSEKADIRDTKTDGLYVPVLPEKEEKIPVREDERKTEPEKPLADETIVPLLPEKTEKESVREEEAKPDIPEKPAADEKTVLEDVKKQEERPEKQEETKPVQPESVPVEETTVRDENTPVRETVREVSIEDILSRVTTPEEEEKPKKEEELRIPDKPENTAFLEGMWRCSMGDLCEVQTGKPVQLEFTFDKNGKGKARIVESGGRIFSAKADARMENGKLRVKTTQFTSPKTSQKYNEVVIDCKNKGQKALCEGVNGSYRWKDVTFTRR